VLDLSAEQLKEYSLVLVGFSSLAEVEEISKNLHALNVPFSCAATYGAYSMCFFDVG